MKLYTHIFAILFLGITSAIAMDTPADTGDKVTFACDWCQEQKEALTLYGPQDATLGVKCAHVLCDTCYGVTRNKYDTNDQFFWCRFCQAFYQEKNKVCWWPWPQDKKPTVFDSGSAHSYPAVMMKKLLKVADDVNARKLPDVTAVTQLPVNPSRTATTHKPASNDRNLGMSSAEKTELKRQLKAAKTSDEMRQVLNTKLQKGQKIKLNIDNFARRQRIYFTSETPGEVLNAPLLRSVCSAVDEVFFEDMHPFFFEQEDEKIALARLEKYTWAEGSIVGILGSIFKIKKQLDKDGRVFRSDEDKLPKFQFIKNRVAEVSGENRLFGGKNDFSKRLVWSADKTLEAIIFSSKTTQYTVGGIIAVVVIGGIYYRYFGKVAEQDGEENEGEDAHDHHETI